MKDHKKPNPEENNWKIRKGLRSELVTEHLANLLAARYAEGDDLQVLTTPPSDSEKPKLDDTELTELLIQHVHTLLRVALSKDTRSEAAIEIALSLVKTLADCVEGISLADSPARPIQRLAISSRS
ncbi:MAG: hypothetical protein AB8B97_22745 [Granulosicoccus sp.]